SLMLKRRALLIVILLAISFGSTAALFTFSAGAQTDERQAEGNSGVAEARADGVEMTVKAGFGRVFVHVLNGTWVPFRIAVANQGEAVNGRLIVRVETDQGPSQQYREFVKEVQLPTGSRQYHEISALLSSDEPCKVQLVSGDTVIAEATLNVQGQWGLSDEMEIGVVDTDATTLNNITSTEIFRTPNRLPFSNTTRPNADPAQAQAARLPAQPLPPPPVAAPQASPSGSPSASPSAAPSPVPPVPPPPPRRRGFGSQQQSLIARPTVVSSEDLPRDYVSYDQLDALILGDGPLSQLTEDQARALRLWVASGGLLIVTGGADFAGLRATGLDNILPVEAQGASAGQLSELTSIYGEFESAEQSLVMSARVRPGARVLVGSDDRPVAAEKNYGAGLVRFVAFNPKLNPYRGWGPAKDLWSDLLLPAVENRPKPVNWITRGMRQGNYSNDYGIHNYLFKLAEIEPPSSRYVLLFLLAYVVLVGPLNYLILRWKRKTDLAWLTIPAVVLLFTTVSVAVAQVSRGGRSIAADVSLVELHQNDGLARVTTGIMIMPTSKDTHDIRFAGHNTYANDMREDMGPGSSTVGEYVSKREPQHFVMSVPMNTWTSTVFQSRSIKEGAPALVSLASASPTSVAVKNLAGSPIKKAVLMTRDGITEPFDLDGGEQKQVALAQAEPSTFAAWYAKQLAASPHESEIFEDLTFALDREIGGQPAFLKGFFEKETLPFSLRMLERPVLVGFVEESPAQMDFSHSLKRTSKSFYVIHL
ncbi:MAG TPA: hypothetical protein VJQ56_16375, partial [Blastocatellia bacterium]|nr:hypothetical protein [Blastocatellia bacterium]